jgi:hypothetical protein
MIHPVEKMIRALNHLLRVVRIMSRAILSTVCRLEYTGKIVITEQVEHWNGYVFQ